MRPSLRGFTLLEILVVMLIFGIVIAMAAAITRGVVAGQKRTLTATRLATVETALLQYVMQRQRLPCPANGTLLSSNNNAGLEVDRDAAGCKTTPGTFQTNGVVPWRELGLSENDATDGWDRRLTYRVGPTLAADFGMNMSGCDPAGTEPGAGPSSCTAGCTNANLVNCTPPSKFLKDKGLQVRNVAGTVLMDPSATPHTGAAYVVISAGESGGGGYLSSGQLGASSLGADGNEEMKNYASLPYAFPANYLVDDSLAEGAGANHFDDIVLRPSVLGVATKAGLGPRAH